MTEGLRTLAFGELESDVWGLAWGSSELFVAIGSTSAGASARPATTLVARGEAEEWRLVGDGVELVITGQGSPARPPRGAEGDFEQLCRVIGTLARDGAELAVDCLGRRGARSAPIDTKRSASVRDVSAWFADDEGVGLIGTRPRRSSGHDADALSAVWFEPAGPRAIEDPRISTTYGSDGVPRAINLELWLSGEESEPYPRRVAGESLGVGAAGALGELDLRAELLRCHFRGREGLGVYLLGRVR